MATTVRWGTATDAGRVRELNEDSLLAHPPMFAVADGVGGAAAGEVASGIAVAALGRLGGGDTPTAAMVLAAVRAGNAEIRQEASAVAAERGMGSTVVGLALVRADEVGEPDGLLVFNVGDSRAYRCTDARLVQISLDHSLVAELERAGQLTAQEAATHPRRSVITRALGADDDVEIDSWWLSAVPGDRYLLCSDGLTGEVDDEDIARVLSTVPDPSDAAGELVALALTAGGRDNVTVVVLDVTEPG